MKNENAIRNFLHDRYYQKKDPFGLLPDRVFSDLKLFWPLYKYYFNTKLHNVENLPNMDDGPIMVVSNHSGQVPIDGMLIISSFMFELKKPILLRPLVERFMITLPFIGKWSLEGGAVLGDRQNCLNLIKKNESQLVFPEGVEGIAKDRKEFYELKPFSRGFIRMAITKNIKIVPIAVVGAEEFYPHIWHLRKLAKRLKIPALPISLNFIPLPSPVDIYIGKPYEIPKGISPDDPDEILNEHVEKIHNEIQLIIAEGRKLKRPMPKLFNKKKYD